mmetsp:Transcript_36781/g.105190  ORF Transcript_36781/g.105190 Transcript_36781/m.105190 type:complete len:291 (+) Transcript_36781:632-1504(+)
MHCVHGLATAALLHDLPVGIGDDLHRRACIGELVREIRDDGLVVPRGGQRGDPEHVALPVALEEWTPHGDLLGDPETVGHRGRRVAGLDPHRVAFHKPVLPRRVETGVAAVELLDVRVTVDSAGARGARRRRSGPRGRWGRRRWARRGRARGGGGAGPAEEGDEEEPEEAQRPPAAAPARGDGDGAELPHPRTDVLVVGGERVVPDAGVAHGVARHAPAAAGAPRAARCAAARVDAARPVLANAAAMGAWPHGRVAVATGAARKAAVIASHRCVTLPSDSGARPAAKQVA